MKKVTFARVFLPLASVIGLVTGVALGGLVLGAQGRDDTTPRSLEDGPPVPTLHRWVDPHAGSFRAPVWDDRHIPDAEKARNPLPPDPRWAPFADCMIAQGYDVVATSGKEFTQADLDTTLSRVNEERPDIAANKALQADASLGGFPGAYVNCADEWLAIPVRDFAEHGLVMPTFD